jgi:hypothetical protein
MEGIAGLSRSAMAGPGTKAGGRADGLVEVDCSARSRSGADKIERWRVIDLCRLVEERWGVVYSETGMLPLLWSLDLAHRKTRRSIHKPTRRRRTPSKKGFATRLSEIVLAHPESERFEVWSQDEARVGQKGRTGYIWWQRGHTPRGRRDLGHRSAWIIGAVCPVRDTG